MPMSEFGSQDDLSAKLHYRTRRKHMLLEHEKRRAKDVNPPQYKCSKGKIRVNITQPAPKKHATCIQSKKPVVTMSAKMGTELQPRRYSY